MKLQQTTLRRTTLRRFALRAVFAAVLLATGAATGLAEDWADLTGKFVYDGTAPEPKELAITADVDAFGKLGLVDESLVVDKKTLGIANIVIYVRTKDVKINPDLEKGVKKEAKFDNKNARFVPRVLPVWLDKQTLCLCNSDAVPHNSNVQPFGDTGINPLLPPKSEVEHTFAVEQMVPVPVKCNIHPWMQGFILPRSNPYVAVTGTDGSFKLEKLPADTELEFQVWQEKSGYLKVGDWKLGRFKKTLKAGEENSLGTVKVDPKLFMK